MDKLTFVAWKWTAPAGYRSKFEGEHVNILRNMIARNYRAPHEVVCITDDARGIDSDIRIIPLWDEFCDIPSPHDRGPHRINPSCYRRLRMFRADAGAWLGERIVSMDLDTVIVGDITKTFQRKEDFVIYGDTNPTTPYNGSLILLRAGTRAKVYDDFKPDVSPLLGLRKGYFGSDQAWIAVALGPNEPKWSRRDGIYSYRNEIGHEPNRPLPDGAKLVSFHGHVDPWHPEVQDRHPWAREHYR